MPETAQLQVRLDLTGNFSSGITNAQKQLNGLSGSVGRVGKGLGQVGAGFARAGLFVGGAAVTGLGAAAKAAIDFEDAFAGVRKTVDEADLSAAGSSFEELALDFRRMATEIPIAATEFARLGETAGALGVKADDIDEFVRTTALLGVTTDLSADAAADALGRLGTILQFTGDDYEDFADSLVALGNAGASTESEIIEISKRFAAEGNAAGLAAEQIAGLASATASLGFAPERGGTALARVFANMGTNISLANSKGKEFAEITGRSIKDLQSSIDRGEGLGIFLDVLEGIKGLSPTEANRTLKALGITNTSDRTIFRSMADNLPFVIEQLGIAADASGALGEEAQKRFDTIASKIQLLKNGLTEVAINIGEGMLPAIGRATEKLTKFLSLPENTTALKTLGEDIGKAIDGIDWNEVLKGAKDFLGVMKGALSFAKMLFDIFNGLPTQIKAATVGFLALNKLSGGLIGAGLGNVVGGLAGALTQGLASRAPGVGRLFAQPVFVTNWPIGGLGGGGVAGAAGKGGGIVGAATKALSVAAIAASVLGVIETQQQVSGQNSAIATDLQAKTSVYLQSSPTTNELLNSMGAVDRGIAELQANPLHVLVQGDALQRLQDIKADINRKLAETALQVQRKGEQTVSSVDTNKAATDRVRNAAAETARETSRSGGLIAQTTRSGTAQVVGAIYANRPITNVSVNVNATTVQKSVVVKNRYGTGGGGRNSDTNGSGTLGNGGR